MVLAFLQVFYKGSAIDGLYLDPAPIFVLLQVEGVLVEEDFSVDLFGLGIDYAEFIGDEEAGVDGSVGWTGFANPAHNI